ncbi:two-component system, chemotaxis family, sensor histidine kinase and response regulator WspE [Maridesulfovibrio ferrireducens]|uniref:histidine kinase n=1 Tax=Maridesulfovibrio ferrireducens TaxID=246191 RepID=A0A1G9CFW6_9BACT|nr:Hpt domain-containing protein [Maridesulfovibrio ferrireducens]SDK50561.1 two-component system, chemotaxis family, sensor histidine kinase and response regulator WspE [Maridesulfovibrio ferrireducens]
MTRDMGDLSMLELFRMEAENHTKVLFSGLPTLAEGDHSSELVEPLMRAAASLKGAARIVGLADAIEVAGTLESVLELCRSGKVAASASLIEGMLSATEFLSNLAAVEVEEMDKWLEDNSSSRTEIVSSLQKGKDVEPIPVPTLKPEPESKPEILEASPKKKVALADASMLDLFRMEAESHSQSLSSGLLELEKDQSPENVEPLMRAAHSLKGAGRIVGLNGVVELSHAMEDVLEACRKGERVLVSQDIDRLLAATDFFSEMAKTEADQLETWLSDNSSSMQSVAKELAKPPSVQSTVPEISEPQVVEPPVVKLPVEQASPVEPKVDIPLADLSMLDLFRMEAESNSQSLTAGLLALEKDQSADKVEPLMRAAHSMKGAARIVGLTDAVALAHAMEDLLVACQKGEVKLTADQIDVLLASTDIYGEVAQLDTDAIQGFLTDEKPTMDLLEKGLRGDEAEVKKVLSEIKSVHADIASDKETAVSLPEENEKEISDKKSKPEVKEPASPLKKSLKSNDAVVRVSAGNLNRLMALAGESLVEAGRLGTFASSLLRLKSGQRDLMKAFESAGERVGNGESLSYIMDEIKAVMSENQILLATYSSDFDTYRRRSDNISGRLYNEVVASRMRPFSDGGRGFPRLVRDLARSLGKEVDFVVEGEATAVDRDILERLEAPLNHIIRNSVDHGIEMGPDRIAAGKPSKGTIKVIAGHRAGMLFIEVRDDGKGINPESIRAKVVEKKLAPGRMAAEMSRAELMEFLFLPGFSTAGKVTEISGRGVGLDVVHAMVQEVGGTVRADSVPGEGMSFSMQLPLTLSVIRTLLVEISGEPYALPLSRISRIASILPAQLKLVEDRQYVSLDNANVGLVPASQILGTETSKKEEETVKVVVISDRMNKYGLVVDDFMGEQDLVVRPLDHRFGNVPDVNSVALMPDGSPVLILDAEDLVRSIDNLLSGGRLSKVGMDVVDKGPVQRILVVDDSLTVREVERKLLTNHGYEVDTAVDGMDGFNALATGHYDLVVTDVDMPRMNGLELTKKIKSDSDLKSIPVMMVSYKDREEDKLRGLEAGADYYFTKSSFHDETLLTAVEDLIGEVMK